MEGYNLAKSDAYKARKQGIPVTGAVHFGNQIVSIQGRSYKLVLEM
jgi:hypothetical protein